MAGRSKPVVLHLVSSFEQGGSELQALQLVRLLAQSGRYSVRLACLRREGPLLPEAEQLTTDIAEFRITSFYNFRALAQVRRFAERLHHDRVAIIQTHDFYSNVFGMTGGALARVPVRIAARRETGGVRTRPQKIVERVVYRLADTVVVNARAVADQLVREGVPRAKTSIVYNGLDLARFTAPAREHRDQLLAVLGLPIGDNRAYVTLVANMRYTVKDHPTFLRAASIVKQVIPDTLFVIAGEGELLNDVRAMARNLSIEQDTVFLGRCEHIRELLALSKVCVLSSIAEGFPNSVLEYMASGRPVVATDVGGVREAVADGETGYLVRIGDAEHMADRLILLLENPEQAKRMGSRGRQLVEGQFSCAAQLSRTEALYDALLASRTRAER